MARLAVSVQLAVTVLDVVVGAASKVRLHAAAPVIFAITWAYAVFNIWLSYFLFIAPVHFLMSSHYWAIIFLAIGLIGGLALIIDHWWIIRLTLELGLAVKCMWMVFLFPILLTKGGAVTLLWTLAAVIQGICVVYFPSFTAKPFNVNE